MRAKALTLYFGVPAFAEEEMVVEIQSPNLSKSSPK